MAIRTPESAAVADQIDGVHVEEEGGGAAVFGGLGVKDVSRAEGEGEPLDPGGVLVEEVAEVGRGVVGCGDGEEHETPGRRRRRRGGGGPSFFGVPSGRGRI